MLAEGVFIATAASRSAAAAPARPSSPSRPRPSSPDPETRAPEPDPVPSRRPVPLTFNPIINDEANILAAIASGESAIPDLARRYDTTVSAFCLWLQREDIQQKLTDLATCGATLTRVAAINQLPKAVKAMSFQIEGYLFDRTHNLIKPGLEADRIAATREANIRKAANLLLRLARFDPTRPVYRKREPKILPRQGEVPPKAAEGATAFPTGSPQPPASASPRSLTTPEPRTPEPDLQSLCSAALSAITVSHSADSAFQARGRAGEPSVPLPFVHDQARNGSASPATPTSQPFVHSNGAYRHEPHTANSLDDPHPNGHASRNGRAPPRSASWL